MHTIIISVVDTIYTFETISICAGDMIDIFGNDESTAGTYLGTFESAAGCDSIHSINLIVWPPPGLDFYTDTIYCDYDGTTIIPLVTEDDLTYVWTPSTWLSCNDCPAPYVTPLESGWYYVTVTNADGCSYTDSVFIALDLSSEIGIPNAFSPNNDGVNDAFNVILNGGCQLDYFRIYNRWGQLIFETYNLNKGWDVTIR